MKEKSKKQTTKKGTPAASKASLTRIRHTLFEAAKKAQKNSYSPYSHARIGAAILDSNGQIFNGCNVENASYGGTICAERTAILKAISEGARMPITHVLVVSSTEEAWPPCGLCRQVLSEFASADALVFIANDRKVVQEIGFQELMPFAFSPSFLAKSHE